MLERTLSLLIALLTTPVCNAAPRCDEMPTALATMRTIDQSLRERLAESDRVNPRIAEVLAIVDGQNTKSLSHLLCKRLAVAS